MSSPNRPIGLLSVVLASPWAKTVIWILAVAAAGGAIQAGAWLIGADFNILSQSIGRGVLLTLALAGLVILMTLDRRTAADYGLVVGEDWPKQLFGSFLLGAATYGAWCLLVLAAGAASIGHSEGWYPWASGALSGLTAFPLAFAEQLIFSGYLLCMFRDRHGRWTAVVIISLLFAGASRLDNPLAALDPASQPLLLGMFLIAAFLAVQRLQSGGLVLPTGTLAGWVFLRKVISRTHLLDGPGDPEVARWLLPSGDPRQSPLLWGCLLAGIAIYVWRTRSASQPANSGNAGIATSFKRYFPLSSPSLLAPLDIWLARLWHARFAVGWRYLPRLAATLCVSIANTLVGLPERLLLPLVVRNRRVPDPVFILGVHRSGTTHLHNLLALDPQFVTPRTYHIMNPLGCVFSGWVVTPLLGVFLPGKRPMDDMKFHLFSPQEEEFALMNMTRRSPYWGLTFPRQGAEYDRYIFPSRLSKKEYHGWRQTYMAFLKRLTFWTRRQPLLKNPHNTGRALELRGLFPNAKFIHLHRHPYAVYRSNVHMSREAHCLTQLQDPVAGDTYADRFLDNYRAMEDAYYAEAAWMAPGESVEVRFEDLELDPMGQIERIYCQLGLALSPRFREKLDGYLASVASYQKNRFSTLPEETRRLIYGKLQPLFDRWRYDNQLDSRPRGQAEGEPRVPRTAA